MTKRTGLLLFLILSVLLFTAGCTKQNAGESSDGLTEYTTQYAQSPLEYTLFINKEIEPITNELMTQMLLATSVAKGEYPQADALDSANSALETIRDSIDTTDTMNPPSEYEDLRTNVLKSMRNCENDIETYIELLQKDGSSKEIDALVKIMQGDYNALTGYFNVPNK